MSAAGLELASGPVSWGVDFASDPSNPPWPTVLDEIAASGLGALELGPIGYLPEEREPLAAALGERGLRPVGSFVFDDLHDPRRADQVRAAAARACEVIAAAGGEVLVLIDRPAGERAGTAGRSDAAPRLEPADWRAMVELIDELAASALAAGLRPAVHPHAGSRIEFQDEIERLLADSAVDLCLDLGHLAFAGIAADAALEAWGRRLAHLHLKDVDPAVLATVRSEELDFWEAVAAGVFCPLGDGIVDFAAAGESLRRLGYRGFATIEQDRLPGSGEPLAELKRSIAALAAAGLTGGAR